MAAIAAALVTGRHRKDRSCLTAQTKAKPCVIQAEEDPLDSVLSVLVTILADTHERPERHTHRGLRHDSVPALHVEPIHARLRQLRIVIQEFEQDDVEVVAQRPESKHAETTETKAQTWAKKATERAIHRTKPNICNYKKCPGRHFLHYGIN